jgi:Fungal specific transcription factor domain
VSIPPDPHIHALTPTSAVNATARDYYGFTSAMSYARLVLAASTKEPLPTGMKKELPPRHAANALVQQYIQHIQVLLPILEETTFYPSLNNVYDPSPHKATPYDHWAVRMVLAIASAGQSQQRGDTYYSDAVGHICAAIEHAELVLHPGSIWSIQAMLLLVLYAMLDPNHFDSWTLIGAAARAMVDLGLHQDPSKSAQTPRAKLELRRRVYYCVFALDRSVNSKQTPIRILLTPS